MARDWHLGYFLTITSILSHHPICRNIRFTFLLSSHRRYGNVTGPSPQQALGDGCHGNSYGADHDSICTGCPRHGVPCPRQPGASADDPASRTLTASKSRQQIEMKDLMSPAGTLSTYTGDDEAEVTEKRPAVVVSTMRK